MYQAIVIDDEKWVVKSLIATIKNQDYFEITTEFYDGLSGLEYIRIHQPALAFVDVRLPGMGGLEILQAAHAEGLSTLFIMISGHAEFAYAQKAMFHNAIGYCLKPFSRSELMDSMQKAYQLLQEQEQKAEDMEYKYQQALSRKKAAELEIHEIEQAIKAIEQAGRSIQKTFGQELNEKISKIFSDVTNGKYTKVVMDDSLRMMVYDGFDYIDMKYLSNATIEQLYFALRLASADLLYEDDGFPLFLDDVFGNYDDERLKQTLGYLERRTDRQIFLFTGRKEILHVLDQNEISYHLISL